MSRFKFRLAALLRLRETARDERRGALAEAYRVDDALRQRLERIAAELVALKELSRRAAGPGTVDIDRLVDTQRYELVTKSQQFQILRQRETIAAEIERRRQALIDADREVRLLEKLRERQAEQHRQEEARREVNRLDEVAVQRAAREASR